MNKKEIIIPMLTVLLLSLAFSFPVHSDQAISKGQLVSDTIPSGSHKEYYLSEELPKGSVFTICIKVNKGGYGTFHLQRGTELVFSWTAGMGLPAIYTPIYYSCFITRSGAYLLNVTSSWGESLNYTFFYDFSEPLQTSNTKSMLLEGGVSYHVDLNSGDRVSLNLTSPSGSDFDIYVYFGYSYMTMISPPIGYTVSSTSSETLNFTAENGGRYFIFVISSMGTGTFYLRSSIIPQAPTYEELQAAELGNIRNLIYILIATTIISIATTVYFAARKPPNF